MGGSYVHRTESLKRGIESRSTAVFLLKRPREVLTTPQKKTKAPK